jgi:hypothetical protein
MESWAFGYERIRTIGLDLTEALAHCEETRETAERHLVSGEEIRLGLGVSGLLAGVGGLLCVWGSSRDGRGLSPAEEGCLRFCHLCFGCFFSFSRGLLDEGGSAEMALGR